MIRTGVSRTEVQLAIRLIYGNIQRKGIYSLKEAISQMKTMCLR